MQFERYDPRQKLSRTIQDTFEGGPVNEAVFSGGGVIAMTYGDLATRLVDHDIIEPDLDIICKLLEVKRNNWASKSGEMAVTGYWDVDNIVNYIAFATCSDEYAKAEEKQLQAREAIVEITRPWRTNESPEPYIEQLEIKEVQVRELNALFWHARGDNSVEIPSMQDLMKAESDAHIAGMHARAVRGGLSLPLINFIAETTALDIETGVFGGKAVNGIQILLDEFIHKIGDVEDEEFPEIPVSEIYIGSTEINIFGHFIVGSLMKSAKKAKDEMVQKLHPVFYATSYEELELFKPTSKR